MNKIVDVVIIGRNEGNSVDKIINCLPSEWDIYYVADRCTDNTIEKLGKYSNVCIIDTTERNLEGRQTSFCRNLGLSYTDPERDVLFLDGDRWIEQGDIRRVVNQAKKDITLLTLAEGDERTSKKFKIEDFYGKVINGFYSCGMIMKRSAIDKVTSHELMKREFKRFVVPYLFPQLFPESLQEDWGIEDTSLGDLCYSIGLSVNVCKTVRLHGKFEKRDLESLDVIEKRFIFRKKLNVLW